ncbi:sugar transferase [Marinigracilibium pacificum]|uniref:Response regulator n=1 Tax=Marinigracilibium pacificum TaxID=2729599 RepID=A0A848IY85_9BACT|nr:sugar transferase [Marinigracilibium pacificum]NMM47250.1 response regulator [Marinigracilibium pacificum]
MHSFTINESISNQTLTELDSFVTPKNKKRNIILYIGFNGIAICQQMVNYAYDGLALNETSKAFKWLEEQLVQGHKLPTAIICDADLPNDAAFDLFNKLKSNNYFKHLPFILLSTTAKDEDKEKALRYGVDDYYDKNVNVEDLVYRIQFLKEYKTLLLETEEEKGAITFHKKPKIPTLKRLFDIVISGLILLFISPILLVVALIIKLESKGPIFYISKRAGSGYQIFDFYKFRSMRVGADKELEKLKHLNQYNESGSFVKISNDPRITRFGKFLRNSSLDELPQLFNVLKGDMSLVGNRPLPLYEAEQLTVDIWAKRFDAPAGITGLWQVTKRGKAEMSEKERMLLDVAYAKRFSLLFDISILLKTIPALLQKDNV